METHDHDIVIVGCGMAGLAAGIRALELGDSAVVLEKSPKEHRGGHTRFTESFRIPSAEIDVDAEFNVDDYSTSEFYSDIMKVTNIQADPDLTKVVSTGAVETFEWLTDLGLDWE